MTTKEEREAFWAGLEDSRKEHYAEVAEALRQADDVITAGQEAALYNAGLTPLLDQVRTNLIYLAKQLVPEEPLAADVLVPGPTILKD